MNEEIVKFKLSKTMYGAILVLSGEYGTGAERIAGLKEDGFDSAKVQECVNDLVKVRNKYE